MQVDPAKLVELADTSDRVLSTLRSDWQEAYEVLADACSGLGDARGTLNLSAAYADAMGEVGEVVAALSGALEAGVAGVLDAVHDAVSADDTVAGELQQALRQVDSPAPRGHGGRHGGGR